MMFCHKCGSKLANDATFCHKCGTKVEYVNTGPQVPGPTGTYEFTSGTRSQSDTSSTLRCPNCNSSDLVPITETTTNVSGRMFGFEDACCGWILLGPLGLLCGLCGSGVESHTETETYWVCKSCGNKFRNPADIRAEVETGRKTIRVIFILLAIVFLACFIIGISFRIDDISFYLLSGCPGIVLAILSYKLSPNNFKK